MRGIQQHALRLDGGFLIAENCIDGPRHAGAGVGRMIVAKIAVMIAAGLIGEYFDLIADGKNVAAGGVEEDMIEGQGSAGMFDDPALALGGARVQDGIAEGRGGVSFGGGAPVDKQGAAARINRAGEMGRRRR